VIWEIDYSALYNIMKRCILIVVDSLGCGDAPDAIKYNKLGANTIRNVASKTNGLNLPTFDILGLGKVTEVNGFHNKNIIGSYGKMTPQSVNNDSTTGHWELAGIVSEESFSLYPEGFPEEILTEISEAINYEFIGNKHASGTEIIEELGMEHLNTKKLILYTSGDSVFQIAAHEDVMTTEELYRVCKISRTLLDKYRVGRVIARPFIGNKGEFKRTYDRKDFGMKTPDGNILELLHENGFKSFGIGKIEDLFGNDYLHKSIHTNGDEDGLMSLINSLETEKFDFTFINLVDCDMLYGHRENANGYAQGLDLIDRYLARLLNIVSKNDLVLITGDHGNDPTDGDTDHTREYVPIIAYTKNSKGSNLHTRDSFTDVGKTIAEYFEIENTIIGKSFLKDIIK